MSGTERMWGITPSLLDSLKCRILGHRWEWFADNSGVMLPHHSSDDFASVEACGRCGVESGRWFPARNSDEKRALSTGGEQ